MYKLFSPAVILMNRIRYPYKLTLIALLFLLPLTVTLYYFESEINRGIEFVRTERQGTSYEAALTGLLENVLRVQHIVCAGHPTGVNVGADVADIAKGCQDVDRSIELVDALD